MKELSFSRQPRLVLIGCLFWCGRCGRVLFLNGLESNVRILGMVISNTRASVDELLAFGGGIRCSVCEGAIIISEAICGGIFRVMFGKGEETLSVYSRAFNKSTNVGIFRHRRSDAPD